MESSAGTMPPQFIFFWEAQFETTVRRSWAKLKSDPKLKGET